MKNFFLQKVWKISLKICGISIFLVIIKLPTLPHVINGSVHWQKKTQRKISVMFLCINSGTESSASLFVSESFNHEVQRRLWITFWCHFLWSVHYFGCDWKKLWISNRMKVLWKIDGQKAVRLKIVQSLPANRLIFCNFLKLFVFFRKKLKQFGWKLNCSIFAGTALNFFVKTDSAAASQILSNFFRSFLCWSASFRRSQWSGPWRYKLEWADWSFAGHKATSNTLATSIHNWVFGSQ